VNKQQTSTKRRHLGQLACISASNSFKNFTFALKTPEKICRMGGGSLAKEYPYQYLGAAALAACLNYPLWRASAVGQSGFRVAQFSIAGVGVPASLSPYVYAFAPPYKGMVGVVFGMTWARAAIFWGSDRGKEFLQENMGVRNETISTLLPPLVVSTLVQCINQPIVRASITLQNPKFNCPDTSSAVRYIVSSIPENVE